MDIQGIINYLTSAKTQQTPGIQSPIPQNQVVPHQGGLGQDMATYKQGIQNANQGINQFTTNWAQGVQKLNNPNQPTAPKVPVSPIKSQVVSKPAPTMPKEVLAAKTTPKPTPQPTLQATPTFKYQSTMEKVAKEKNLTLNDFHLLRAGENKSENPDAVNVNDNGTVDVGLYQVNANANDAAEIQRLKNPEYNAQRAADIWKQRVQTLQDPVLAIASYNLGAGGAVLNPEAAIQRAQWVYYNAGIPMPQTEFTKNPQGYVQARMNQYKEMGLFN